LPRDPGPGRHDGLARRPRRGPAVPRAQRGATRGRPGAAARAGPRRPRPARGRRPVRQGGAHAVTPSSWQPDVLGPGYERRPVGLEPDDEGEVVVTVVRRVPDEDEPVRPARAVLYLHGWSDYFFQTELADTWHGLGAAFYALDLRKYGRSLRPHQTPGYVDHLTEYDADIAAALGVIREDLGAHAAVMLMGHSTGGLVAALWAHRHPGAVRGLVLNSPWLELQGSSVARTVSGPAIRQLARFQPRAPLPNVDPGYYARTLQDRDDGTWVIDDAWRPVPSFPVRAGWLRAIISGHARVAAGLSIDCPVLVLLAERSLFSTRWTEEMREADIVLDVEPLARRASHLGRVVTLVRIPGGMHDLALSAPRPRALFFAEIVRWSAASGWS